MTGLTLKDLQAKSWYRLLKVLFCLLFIVILIPTIIGIFYSALPTINNEQSRINCLLGNRKTFSASELDIHLSAKDFRKDGSFNYKEYFERYYSTQYDIRKIFEACSLEQYVDYNDANIFLVQAATEVNHDQSLTQEDQAAQLKNKIDAIKRDYGSDASRFLNYDPQIFTIQPVYESREIVTIVYLLLATISISGLFELIRRIFYYIVLGEWNPNKSNHSTS